MNKLSIIPKREERKKERLWGQGQFLGKQTEVGFEMLPNN